MKFYTPYNFAFRALESLYPGMDNYLRYQAGRIPVLGDLARMYDSNMLMSDYMRNRNLSWSDIKYPSLVGQGGSVSSVMRMFEPDVDSYQALYEDHPRHDNRYYSVYKDDWTSNPMYH